MVAALGRLPGPARLRARRPRPQPRRAAGARRGRHARRRGLRRDPGRGVVADGLPAPARRAPPGQRPRARPRRAPVGLGRAAARRDGDPAGGAHCSSAWASPVASWPTRWPSPASSSPTPSWPCRSSPPSSPTWSGEASRGDLAAFGRSLRWTLDGMVQLRRAGQRRRGGVRAPGDGGAGLRPDQPGRRATHRRRRSPPWPPGCCPTGRSCCSSGPTTPSAKGRAPAVVALGSAGLGAVLMAAGGALAARRRQAGRHGRGAQRRLPGRRRGARASASLGGRASRCSPTRLPQAAAVWLPLGAAVAAILHWVD